MAACAGSLLVLLGSLYSLGAGPTKILLIGKDRDHPYTTHEYMADCELLAKCLRQTEGVSTVVSNGWPADPKSLDDLNAIVLLAARGGNLLFASPHRRKAEELLAKGVGLSAIHYGTGADPGEGGELWQKALGGWFHNSFSQYLVRPSELRAADGSLPVCQGVTPIRLIDEFYINLRFEPSAKPAFLAPINGKDQPIGWIFERPDKGRSFGFVGGHFHNNLGLKPFRQAIVNGILWTARVEIPTGGAPCNVVSDDMKLPPPDKLKN
jgi:hypothetical protein